MSPVAPPDGEAPTKAASHRPALRLSRNIAFSLADVAVSSVVIFVVYKVAIAAMGIEMIGVWSVLTAVASLGNMMNLGLANSMPRFVPVALAERGPAAAAAYVETAATGTAVIYAVMGLAIYVGVEVALPHFAAQAQRPAISEAMPYVCVSVFLASVSLVFQSALRGVQRSDLTSAISVLGYLIYLAGALLLVGRFSLLGLAWAQMAQGAFMAIAALLSLRRRLPGLAPIPFRWHVHEFRSMIGYGLGYQLLSALAFFLEPTTKLLVGIFGGMGPAGYYELSSRVVGRTLLLISALNAAVVPAISHLHATSRAAMERVYDRSREMTLYLSFPAFAALAGLSPALSRFWIGAESREFVAFCAIGSFGYLTSTFCSPEYYLGVATGYLRGNVVGNILNSALNVALGAALGAPFGAYGVAVGSAAALAAGNAYIILHNSRHFFPGRGFGRSLPGPIGLSFISSLAALGLGSLAYIALAESWPLLRLAALVACVHVANLLVLCWCHPERAALRTKLVGLRPGAGTRLAEPGGTTPGLRRLLPKPNHDVS